LPTPIQCDAIPAILGGGDVLIAAETGSGKTGAFSLPVVQIVWERRKDQMNPKSGGSSGGVGWRLNLGDRAMGLSLSQDGLSCESRVPKAWFGSRCMGGVHTRGKYYYEAKITRDGLCRIGWSTLKASLDLGTDQESFGFGGTGMKSTQRKFEKYGESFTTGDVLGCYLDLDNGRWSKNGKEFEVAYRLDGKFSSPHCAMHPAVLVQNSSLQLNFGATPFAFPPKEGIIAVCEAPANLIEWRGLEAEEQKNDSSAAPVCIVLEPTKELIDQTHDNLVKFSKNVSDPKLRCVSLAAGLSMAQVLNELDKGVDIVTGGVGRVLDMIETRKLSTTGLNFVVIDEADQILSQWKPQLERLLMINVTLPDEAPQYVHRIGRVGRAERMGLSISLVSTHNEKVWYHKCGNRSCRNTEDLSKGGCTIWYNEPKLLADIEEHLGQTISVVDSAFQIPVDEFDGKIVYGAKRTNGKNSNLFIYFL
uniref:ATP-dependent RNA helicase n=1 Tax=Nippostrongylus brasiliensis TaxID=27835 RepID=A0A158R384_NIPBR